MSLVASSYSGSIAADRIIHEGGRNVSYDLTGKNKSYSFEAEYVFYVSNQEQVIDLPFPCYCTAPADTDAARVDGDGIAIEAYDEYLTSRSAHVESTKLEYSTSPTLPSNSWGYVEEDQTSMAKAHRLWNHSERQFNGIIVRRIRVNAGSQRVVLKVKMQRFYMDIVDQIGKNTDVRGPLYSRALGQELLDRIGDLETKTEVMHRNMFGTTSAADDILLVDLTGKNTANRVYNELHEINTESGKNLLAPARGSFYPGTVAEGTSFRLNKYYVETGTVDQTMVETGSRNGWLFVFTVNNIKAYTVTTDAVFMPNVAYYTNDPATGDYRRMTENEDYYVGDDVKQWSADNGMSVFRRINVAYDPSKGFDGTVNDTSAYLAKEVKVVLTADNIAKYLNYTGKFIDISFQTAYTLAEGTFAAGKAYYTRSGTVGNYVYTAIDASAMIGQEIPANTYYVETNRTSKSTAYKYGVDYTFANVNLTKTERTYSKQPVYDHVRLLKTMSTDESHVLGLTYQAFGGEVTAEDVRNIRRDVTNATEILGNTHLLTSEGLHKHAVITNLTERLARMESYNDHFAQVDHQVFMGSEGINWINIATIFDTAWMNSIEAIKEIGQFRVSSKELGWCYEFVVSTDMSKDGVEIMNVRTLGANTKHTTSVNASVSASKAEHIMLRLCWNEYTNSATGKVEKGKRTGIVLQLGFDWAEYGYDGTKAKWDNDVITVVNKSSHTSMWRLYNNPLEATKYNDAILDTWGHVQYVQFTGTAKAEEPYYVDLKEYLYYTTSSTYAQSGVEYFRKSELEEAYDELDVSVGADLSALDYDVYERTVYQHVWQRTYLTAGQTVVASDGIYVVDDSLSYQNDAFDFLDGTPWNSLSARVSKSVTKILEADDSGWTVWVGSYPLHRFTFGPNQAQTPLELHVSVSPTIQRSFDLNNISQAILFIYDRRTGNYIQKAIDMQGNPEPDGEEYSTGNGLFCLEDMAGVNIRFTRNGDNTVSIVLECGMGSSSFMNKRFDLRQIRVKF